MIGQRVLEILYKMSWGTFPPPPGLIGLRIVFCFSNLWLLHSFKANVILHRFAGYLQPNIIQSVCVSVCFVLCTMEIQCTWNYVLHWIVLYLASDVFVVAWCISEIFVYEMDCTLFQELTHRRSVRRKRSITMEDKETADQDYGDSVTACLTERHPVPAAVNEPVETNDISAERNASVEENHTHVRLYKRIPNIQTTPCEWYTLAFTLSSHYLKPWCSQDFQSGGKFTGKNNN